MSGVQYQCFNFRSAITQLFNLDKYICYSDQLSFSEEKIGTILLFENEKKCLQTFIENYIKLLPFQTNV